MKRVYGVCHYIFSGRRVCVRHASYILSAAYAALEEAGDCAALTETGGCGAMELVK